MGFDTEVLSHSVGGGYLGWAEPWLAWLDAAIHREILRLRATYEASLDEFRGLYVSDEQVDRLVARQQGAASGTEIDARWNAALTEALGPASAGPLQQAATVFDLPAHDVAAIVVAVATELDARYPVLYAYLQNDVTRRAASVDLVVRLTGEAVGSFQPSSKLFGEGLLMSFRSGLESWRSTAIRPSDALREFLLERGPVAPRLPVPSKDFAVLADPGLKVVVLEPTPGAEALHTAREIASTRGVDLAAMHFLDGNQSLDNFLLGTRLRRQAAYFGSAAFRLDREERPSEETVRLLRRALESPAFKVFEVDSRSPWRSLFEGFDIEVVQIDPPDAAARLDIWRGAVAESRLDAATDDLDAVARLFALHAGQIRNAMRQIGRRGKDVAFRELAEAARGQSASALGSLATREAPTEGWDRLVLPGPTMRRLRELASAIRDRTKVFGEWSFKSSSGGRFGLRAMFSGSSGTGKTLSASVIAHELGLDLYRIDLSGVVNKYIGETERNLDRVFRAAEGSNAILFFDEADALFGKRTEVKDAHDRYSNIEIAYLLQRMERYDGVLILATNLSKNIDEAFGRRVHFDIEFPLPDEADRLRLWRLLIPASAPTADDVDLAFMARQFAIAGGDIRNVALQAAFLAADSQSPIGMRHLVQAMARQRMKQGKLPSASEFKHYFEMIEEEK